MLGEASVLQSQGFITWEAGTGHQVLQSPVRPGDGVSLEQARFSETIRDFWRAREQRLQGWLRQITLRPLLPRASVFPLGSPKLLGGVFQLLSEEVEVIGSVLPNLAIRRVVDHPLDQPFLQ